MDKTELFEKAPIHKAVASMAIPNILSMLTSLDKGIQPIVKCDE